MSGIMPLASLLLMSPKKSILYPYLGNLTTHVAITGNFVLCSSRFLMGWLYRMPNEAWEIEEKRRRRDANSMILDIKLLFKTLLTVALPNSGNCSQVINPFLLWTEKCIWQNKIIFFAYVEIFGRSVTPSWKLYNPYCHTLIFRKCVLLLFHTNCKQSNWWNQWAQ